MRDINNSDFDLYHSHPPASGFEKTSIARRIFPAGSGFRRTWGQRGGGGVWVDSVAGVRYRGHRPSASCVLAGIDPVAKLGPGPGPSHFFAAAAATAADVHSFLRLRRAPIYVVSDRRAL